MKLIQSLKKYAKRGYNHVKKGAKKFMDDSSDDIKKVGRIVKKRAASEINKKAKEFGNHIKKHIGDYLEDTLKIAPSAKFKSVNRLIGELSPTLKNMAKRGEDIVMNTGSKMIGPSLGELIGPEGSLLNQSMRNKLPQTYDQVTHDILHGKLDGHNVKKLAVDVMRTGIDAAQEYSMNQHGSTPLPMTQTERMHEALRLMHHLPY